MMKQSDIFKKIGQILNELNEQYQYLAQNPHELNELELELFHANANFLTDHVQIVKKLNSKLTQKALPEHGTPAANDVEHHPAPLPVTVVDESSHKTPEVDMHDQEMFKLDNESSKFEFILNERPSSDRFEFEDKSVDEIFDRPLSVEEEQIIAQKQRLRELDSLDSQLPEEDEIGPEPFLVSSVKEEQETVIPESAAPDEVQVTIEDPESDNLENITEELPEASPEPQILTSLPIVEVKPIPDQVPVADLPHFEGNEVSSVATLTEPTPEPQVATPEPVPTPLAEAIENITPPETPVADAQKNKPTLNDILSGNNAPKSFTSGTGRGPVTDLKQAISLNDKMRYIRDLFNGYNLAYAEAIDLVNKMPDFKTADAFLQNNYAVKNNWSAKQETADQFYELLNQRFPAK